MTSSKTYMTTVDGNVADTFSVDLVTLSKKHIQFLRSLHSLGTTLTKPSKESIRRYQDLWLPFLAQHSDDDLIPPSDVAWLWHCHRLAPYKYKTYIQQTYNSSVLEASPPFAFQTSSAGEDGTTNCEKVAAESTYQLWQDYYPNEPFFLQGDNDASSDQITDDNHFVGGFDLLGSTERQATFLWQVLGGRFGDDEFLRQGQLNYYKFLKLKATEQGQIQVIVPTYQIDLMWHTHMLSSLSGYDLDCISIMGSTLHHDDSLNDRTEGGTLDMAFCATKELWTEMYKEEYSIPGGMYRGEPPKEFFSRDWATLDSDAFTAGRNGHLAGRTGASSTALPNEQAESHAMAWMDPNGTTPEGKSRFIPKDIRLRLQERKTNYVYGHGSLGAGYYHILTRDYYSILETRIVMRIIKMRRRAEPSIFYRAVGKHIRLLRASLERRKADLEELQAIRSIVTNRKNANGPPSDIGNVPSRTENTTDNLTLDRELHGLSRAGFTQEMCYWAGGGCGGCEVVETARKSLNNGYSGGGGCGGGGCGGGGCGGS